MYANRGFYSRLVRAIWVETIGRQDFLSVFQPSYLDLRFLNSGSQLQILSEVAFIFMQNANRLPARRGTAGRRQAKRLLPGTGCQTTQGQRACLFPVSPIRRRVRVAAPD